MKKRILYSLICLIAVIFYLPDTYAVSKTKKVKYVFYFIGDGMGINQVNGTEMFLAEQEGKIGIKPLNFTQFPINTFATTYSASNSVTCSAAAGTALASGHKTRNRIIGMDTSAQIPLYSIAMKAKEQGKKVGIATNNAINHATPACFYAHQSNRNKVYEIAKELPVTGFDFYAGGNLILSKDKRKEVFDLFKNQGYTLARGYKDYQQKKSTADKMILIQSEGIENENLMYAIDRQSGDLTLEQITTAAIDFLAKDNKKGFFVMIECGLIDWACHSNDAATAFREIEDFQHSIQKAIDFYQKYPDETLIVVTADHETGGIVLGTGKYELNLKALANQKVSKNSLTKKITALRKEKKEVAWEDIKQLLSENLGLWSAVPVKEKFEKELIEKYHQAFHQGDTEKVKSLYAEDEPLANKAVEILGKIAMVHWSSGGHSAGVVPVYVLGKGSDLFQGKLDNTDIPQKILQAMAP